MGDDGIDFRLLFEASPDVLLVLAPDPPRFTMVAATRARYQATQTTPEATIGRGLFELFPDNPDDPEATGTANLRASLDRVLATRAPDTMAVQKYDIRGPDGAFRAHYWSPKNVPVLSRSGEVRYILHRVEDVSELVRATELGEELRGRTREMQHEVVKRSHELRDAVRDLRLANARLGELDAAKTAFFSNVSHEFRTPLALLLGPLEDALADGATPHGSPQHERLRLAHGNALRLLRLVNALLDFARLEAGRLRARFAPVDLGALTAELAGMFQSAFERVGVRLVIDCPPGGEPVWIDRDLWEKIVPNLVSNAFKFTFAGEVAVRVRDRGPCVVLEVADTGIGIAGAELPRVFERFHRVDGAIGRTHEGSGIGLALVRELVELHGGTVEVASELGRGTTFTVALRKGAAHLPPDAVSATPAPVPADEGRRDAALHAAEAARWVGAPDDAVQGADDLDAAPGPDGARARVLVVDDNRDLREYIARLLAPRYDVVVAVDGAAALDAVRAAPPELVVSDVMMPRLDGLGLLRALRAEPATALLPVILLSARAGDEAAVEGLDAGCDDYLVKPFSARELLARVRTHVELARSRRAWIAELEHANRELDAFSYSVSHDLRAPVRAIDGFARILAADHAAALDARGRDCVERISRGARRMGELIDDLLGLARLARAPLVPDEVDLGALADGVIAELRRAHPDRAVAIEIAAGLCARGDRRLLEVVLTNLIGNAWKFTARSGGARIEIGRRDAARSTFYVRDNGAGFDMAYAGRLFAPFQRLHAAGEFEGTGIGLATVQRVIARHGGRVWAEGEVGRGATFLFELP